ncbi:hypothetical protein F5B18DRAFT_609893 [Nemania serpens]|nr:hypothetical protein F5B18DRAFT_609893 [Nemania serpens]
MSLESETSGELELGFFLLALCCMLGNGLSPSMTPAIVSSLSLSLSLSLFPYSIRMSCYVEKVWYRYHTGARDATEQT